MAVERFQISVLMGVLLLAVSACGGGGAGPEPTSPVVTPPPAPTPTGLWIRGDDGVALARFKASVNGQSAMGPELDAAPPPALGDDNGYSGTYTLEANIDEHDILKYNGELLASVAGGCCGPERTALRDPSKTLLPPDEQRPVRLYRTLPDTGSADYLAEIPATPGLRTEGIYLDEQQLQVISSTAWWGVFGDAFTTPDVWQSQQVVLQAWDLTHPDSPELNGLLEVEGALLLSRKRGNVIHLVSRHTPQVDGLIYYPGDAESTQANEALLADLDETVLMPRVTWNEQPVTLPDPDQCFRSDLSHPLAADTPVEVSVTLLLDIDASSGDVQAARCVIDPVHGVTFSEDAVLFTAIEHDAERQSTLVHALALEDGSYRGSARVDGLLFSGGNSDFRINQFEGVIRLVTTTWTNDESDRFHHQLFTLAPAADRPELEVLGHLPGASEQPLGKPNEDLYGVRFQGSRAYVVTFERIDPLYAIDLSDPRAPAIEGTLEIPGFSDLLHPIGDSLLLGVGADGEGHAKVELFDVDNLAAPASLGSLVFMADYDSSYSPAQYNRYTFTVLPGELRDRFILPVSAWRQREERYESAMQMALFSVNHGSTSLIDSGAIDLSEPGSGAYWSVDQLRSVLEGDAIYIATPEGVLSGLWSNPEAVIPVSVSR